MPSLSIRIFIARAPPINNSALHNSHTKVLLEPGLEPAANKCHEKEFFAKCSSPKLMILFGKGRYHWQAHLSLVWRRAVVCSTNFTLGGIFLTSWRDYQDWTECKFFSEVSFHQRETISEGYRVAVEAVAIRKITHFSSPFFFLSCLFMEQSSCKFTSFYDVIHKWKEIEGVFAF